MTYVDRAFIAFGRMSMCHLLADSVEELHAMADRIGIARRHFQISRSGVPHYDICKSKRRLALSAGAIELQNNFQIYAVISRYTNLTTKGTKMNTETGELMDQSQIEQLNETDRAKFVPVVRDLSLQEKANRQINLYSPCGCGSGRKFKFCCHKISR